MAKMFIASDIHGSAYYCDLLLKAYREQKGEKLLLLGDILYHGPRNDLPRGYAPKEVIAMLNAIKDEIICVQGNCDAQVDQMVLEFPISDAYKIIEHDGIKIFATHGHVYNKDALPQCGEYDVLLYGHTHVPLDGVFGGVRCLNPGSVTIPKQNSAHSCLILDNGKFVPYDLCGE